MVLIRNSFWETMVNSMKSVRKPSAAPVYAVAAVWLIYTLLTGLHSLSQVLVCAALSVAAYFLMKAAFPGKTVQVEVPEADPDTGDAELDEIILQGRESIKKIRLLNGKIPDAKISSLLRDLEDTTRKIFHQLEADKAQVKQCRQFLNYYLPTTIHLLERYVELQDQGSGTGSVREAMRKIEETLSTVNSAFRRQLDNLFEKDVVDITAEITVMEQLLKSQGLTGENEFEKER